MSLFVVCEVARPHHHIIIIQWFRTNMKHTPHTHTHTKKGCTSIQYTIVIVQHGLLSHIAIPYTKKQRQRSVYSKAGGGRERGRTQAGDASIVRSGEGGGGGTSN